MQSVPATWRNTGIDISLDNLMSTKKPPTASPSPMKQMSSASGMFVDFCNVYYICAVIVNDTRTVHSVSISSCTHMLNVAKKFISLVCKLKQVVIDH